jgi:hypothetical protein
MSRRDEAADLLKSGRTLAEIARCMGVSMGTVVSYLFTEVGRGSVRRSDIFFAVSPQIRAAVESTSDVVGEDEDAIRSATLALMPDVNRDELAACLLLRDARVALGEMYELVRDLETTLHSVARAVLTGNYDDQWWRKGIPRTIRQECAANLEGDEEPAAEPFCYTTLAHLGEIFYGNWPLMIDALPKEVSSNRQKFKSDLMQLNRIRNAVMHPVKGIVPREADFVFVREFHRRLNLPRLRQITGVAPVVH